METPLPPPTPQAISVALPPSLRHWEEELYDCATGQSEFVLLVEQSPAQSLDVEDTDLVLWLGEPPGNAHFAAPLAWEEIVLILHPRNPLSSLGREKIADLFNGQVTGWEELGGENQEISVWVYPPGNEIQNIFTSMLMKGEKVTSLAYLAPDPAAMVEAVRNDPGAIGILPKSWLTNEVKSLPIEQGESKVFQQPVLALAANEPENSVRALLGCLQHR